MTTLEHIKTVKNVLRTNEKFKSVHKISKATGISYHFMKALIETGYVSKVNGRYAWIREVDPGLRTYNKLREVVRKNVKAETERKPSRNKEVVSNKEVVRNNEVALNFRDRVNIVITNGSAVISRNGARIKVSDLSQLENILKVLS
jgi:hypothetical protein